MSDTAAIKYLCDQARSAHAAGDGARVNHLAALALKYTKEAGKPFQILPSIRDVKWACVLPLYWLERNYMVGRVWDVLGAYVESGDASITPILSVLRAYAWLVEQPLAGLGLENPRLEDLDLAWCRPEQEPEDRVLCHHLVELVWWHARGSVRCTEIVDRWLVPCTEEMRNELATTRDRLALQQRLVIPHDPHMRARTAEVASFRNKSPLAALWLLLLHEEGRLLDDELKRLLKTGCAGAVDARVLFDTHCWNRFTGEWGDDEAVGLTRQEMFKNEAPILVFRHGRRGRIAQLLAQIHRDGTARNAHMRYTVFSLIMLEQLASLRAWDFPGLAMMLRAEAEACFEVCKWEEEKSEWATRGVLQAVRGVGWRKGSDRSDVRQAVSGLEFAQAHRLADLVDALLLSCPLQVHSASDCLQDLEDLVPRVCWNKVARWATERIGSTRRGASGLQLCCGFLPYVEEDSEIWDILTPHAERLASGSVSWSTRDPSLLVWISHAPSRLAAEAMQIICDATPRDVNDELARVPFLAAFHQRDPEAASELAKRLITQTEDWRARAALLPFVGKAEGRATQRKIKPYIIEHLRGVLCDAAPPQTARQCKLILGTPDFPKVATWTNDDRDLVHQVVEVIDSPTVLAQYVPYLLRCLAGMVLHGTTRIARLVIPSLESKR